MGIVGRHTLALEMLKLSKGSEKEELHCERPTCFRARKVEHVNA
jgi:hypothetical protein